MPWKRSAKHVPSEQEKKEALEQLVNDIVNQYKTSVDDTAIFLLSLYPCEIKVLYQFEASIFIHFRLDHYLSMMGFPTENPFRKLISISTLDEYLSGLKGSYKIEWLNTRLKWYAQQANIAAPGNSSVLKKDAARAFHLVEYSLFLGFVERAQAASEWWKTVEINPNDQQPVGGFINQSIYSMEMEGRFLLPIFNTAYEGIKKNAFLFE